MSLLFETIKVIDRSLQNVSYHNTRFNKSRWDLFHCDDVIDLLSIITIPETLGSRLYKCRVVYGKTVTGVEFSPYERRRVDSLALVENNTIEYSHKYVDRTGIELLMRDKPTDDILIVKHGLIADTSYSNVVFRDGSRWITPAVPLLAGTARSRLLNGGLIIAEEIRPRHIKMFSQVALINAMNDLHEATIVDTRCIV